MPRTIPNGRLEEALAVLINSQATLTNSQATLANNQATFLALLAQLSTRTEERFSRIETELAEIRAILLRHEQIMQGLPEAIRTIRDKIGFKTR